VGKTFGNCMTAFTITDNGGLIDRRDWTEFGPRP